MHSYEHVLDTYLMMNMNMNFWMIYLNDVTCLFIYLAAMFGFYHDLFAALDVMR